MGKGKHANTPHRFGMQLCPRHHQPRRQVPDEIPAVASSILTLTGRSLSRRWLQGNGVALCFSTPRFIAFLGPLLAGVMIAKSGGYGRAATLISVVYILGLAAVPLLRETKGKALPE
jgi:hypothetical protein